MVARVPLTTEERQYGDTKALDQFKSETKPLPVSGVPAQKRGAGRPKGSGQAPPPSAPQVPQEHVDLMSRLARAEEVADFWASRANEAPTPLVAMYARKAAEVRDRLALELYKATPNFIP